ncbi:sec-independent protein translocase protein TatA [Geodermatophilus africanus]|jgi:sec-independent protein translocase protein TatA|uniref:Sec-independent protein translocase protein TatA n=1 Tax=Geodermatophilus africanus TaxID=1137993 RepID=A0A1H3LI12_9ACTN|nr:Sec-independent protein translocase subunit TatA [Geodermatophilus africanus]SDY63930.1 sec-independent protein translocase protein TatA [Geodermatophilus africanus]
MPNLGPLEIGLIILAVLLLFGYKKLPDASRSLGRSLRIFKGEMKGMKDDDVRTKDAARTAPVRGEVLPAATAADREREALEAEARAAEARAAELRARAAQAGPADSAR